MAQRAPDWLLNMAKGADNLVEDSPRYRADESAQQKSNLRQATGSALDALAAQRKADLARQYAEERAMRDNQTPTPVETQTNTPRDFGPYEPPERYTGVEDYEPANMEAPPPSPIGPPLSAPDMSTPATLAQREMLPMPDDSPENDDLAGNPDEEVALISRLMGMPPKQVATFALLGEWARNKEDEEYNAGLPVGRASISPGDVYAGGRPSPPPTGAGSPSSMAPPLGGSVDLDPPPGYEGVVPMELQGPPPEAIPQLSGPSPLPEGEYPA